MGNKRYFWLKLLEDFYQSREVKKIRLADNGDKCIVIYQEILLLAMNRNGLIQYDEGDIAEEIAIEINENIDAVQNTLYLLKKYGLSTEHDGGLFFQYAVDNVGSISESSIRSKKSRAKTKNSKISNFANATEKCCNATEIIQNATEKCCNAINNDAMQRRYRDRYREDIEIELDKDKDIDLELEKKLQKGTTDKQANEYSPLKYPEIDNALQAVKCTTGNVKLNRVLTELINEYPIACILHAIKTRMGGVGKKNIDFLAHELKCNINEITKEVAENG